MIFNTPAVCLAVSHAGILPEKWAACVIFHVSTDFICLTINDGKWLASLCLFVLILPAVAKLHVDIIRLMPVLYDCFPGIGHAKTVSVQTSRTWRLLHQLFSLMNSSGCSYFLNLWHSHQWGCKLLQHPQHETCQSLVCCYSSYHHQVSSLDSHQQPVSPSVTALDFLCATLSSHLFLLET